MGAIRPVIYRSRFPILKKDFHTNIWNAYKESHRDRNMRSCLVMNQIVFSSNPVLSAPIVRWSSIEVLTRAECRMSDISIDSNAHEKDLGILIDNKLNMNQHFVAAGEVDAVMVCINGSLIITTFQCGFLGFSRYRIHRIS